jgi:hypothetical protein
MKPALLIILAKNNIAWGFCHRGTYAYTANIISR